MLREQIGASMGQMPQPVRGWTARKAGAVDATNLVERQPILARPRKKKGGCQTCDGSGCVGRCRF